MGSLWCDCQISVPTTCKEPIHHLAVPAAGWDHYNIHFVTTYHILHIVFCYCLVKIVMVLCLIGIFM